MLTQDIKRKIDSARNILVGKVPDPKAQVEQITLALIYKFMDDMDKQAMMLPKGRAQFFTNGYEQYAWNKLMDPRLGGHERLDLYVRSISELSKNPHLPQLFRNIYKNAYLPFNNPETLNLFLKEINSFEYDHSENLGDAFEYLLSILGSQGDAGQFRTPRHIIDFIAAVVDPKKNETVLDPACGTAGFLISAYKHILAAHDGKNDPDHKEIPLTPDERKKLMTNLAGYDISPDMVKLSLVNLYLHGFPNPNIYEYDTLTSEDRWDERFDVIMANPPFMSPKGGIRPHKRFSVQANRSEVLFVDYIMEHLNPKGRAGIIVPEGIIFQSAGAYKQLRKLLVEDGLFAVVSLPAGVFNPYSGVKTSVLFFDKENAKKTDDVLFIKIENDGYDLGAQRRKIEKNDLLEAVDILKQWRNGKKTESPIAHFVPKEKIVESGDYNLSGERYKEVIAHTNQKWSLVELSEIFLEIKNGKNVKQIDEIGKYKVSRIQTIADGTVNLNKTKHTNDKVSENDFLKDGDILFSHINSIDHLAKTAIFENISEKVVHGANLVRLRPDLEKVIPRYASYILKSKEFIENARRYAQKAVNQASINTTTIKSFKIPLPPLEIQKEIVEQIEVKQNAIDHAKAIIQSLERERRYFGQSLIKLEDVELVELGKLFEKVSEQVNPQNATGPVVYVGLENIESNTGSLVGEVNVEVKSIKSIKTVFKKGDLLYGKLRPNLNKVWFANLDGICSTDILVLRGGKKVISEFYLSVLLGDNFNAEVLKGLKGAQLPRVSFDYLKNLKIPLLSLETQKQMVEETEKEEEIITANKKLIELMENKITKVLENI